MSEENSQSNYTFTIKVDNREFKIVSDVNQRDYVNKVTEYLNKEIEKLRKDAPYDSFDRILLLATLNIIDKLFKKEKDLKQLEYVMDRIIERISRVT